ncbi:hypothetical protein [Sciscionella sediminilitoris]|uniref:hypothetical protein n=1 Tax=Sciscionella sediminilitoris TaxID=1445613 RepID=UPI0012E16DC0|nr:hypothetical protein [Sciscionella sp. SE31]
MSKAAGRLCTVAAAIAFGALLTAPAMAETVVPQQVSASSGQQVGGDRDNRDSVQQVAPKPHGAAEAGDGAMAGYADLDGVPGKPDTGWLIGGGAAATLFGGLTGAAAFHRVRR